MRHCFAPVLGCKEAARVLDNMSARVCVRVCSQLQDWGSGKKTTSKKRSRATHGSETEAEEAAAAAAAAAAAESDDTES